MNFFKSHSKTNALVAFLVFTISFVVYFLTMAPSVCLWDCGEYLAASAGLGIPHPPGTPLLILFGRAWIALFSFIKDVGYRYNLSSILCGALTVMFIYLIIIRGLCMVLGEPDTLWKRLTYYCAGFVGGLFCAFGNTYWFESLEGSEQSNITNVPVALSIWLTLVWAQSKSENRDRLLLLIGYLAFLGIGMHMISMITMPAIFLFVMLYDKDKRKDWRLWGACISISFIMYNLSYFLEFAPIFMVFSFVMMFASRQTRRILTVILCIIGVGYVIFNPASITENPRSFLMQALILLTFASVMYFDTEKYKRNWRFCFWFALLALVGFSNHLFLPIRSALNPIIDEGHPVVRRTADFPYFDMKALKEVLDRKQYGNESMVSRSFWRRGSFAHQFGVEGHMGYGGFHLTQFFRFTTKDAEKNFVDGSAKGWGKLLFYLLPTFFMLWGWYCLSKRNRNVAVFFIAITLLTTILMVWYMNFSDGQCCDNRAEYNHWIQSSKQGPMPTIYREVRVRDYFYSAGFMFFGMWIGLSAGFLLYRLFSDTRRQARTLAAPLALVLFAVSPALPLCQNYKLRDRSQNFLPFEYAYNLLMSCEKGGILFTNGDNDTFPVWAVQEAYGIRRDVRLVNLSLVNTDWYIKQLKKVEPRVPVSYTDAQIERLQPEYNPFKSQTPVELTNSKLRIALPGQQQLQVLRVQDKMVLNVVDATAQSKPVYFACSVSPDNFMGLDPYLQMQGMVYRLMFRPLAANERIDTERMAMLLDKVYKIHPLSPRITDRDEPYDGIASDYAICFLYLSMQLQERLSALDQEIKALQTPAPGERKNVPPAAPAPALAEKIAAFNADFDRVVKNLDRCVSLMPWNMQPVSFRHQFLLKFNQPKMAEERVRRLMLADPGNSRLRELLAQALEVQGKRAEAREFLQKD